MSPTRSPDDSNKFALIIDNLTQEQRAIIVRQDKLENILNSNQVILATLAEQSKTLVEQHQKHEQEMEKLSEVQVGLGNTVVSVSEQMKTIRWIGGVALSVAMVFLSAYIGHFIH